MAYPEDEGVAVSIEPLGLEGLLGIGETPKGLVIFAHGSGSGRFSPRNNFVASGLRQAGCATLLLDLLLANEEGDRAKVFDISLLAQRLSDAIRWVRQQQSTSRLPADLPIGLFGASTGAGAALLAAAKAPEEVCAIVSRGGRPDLAGSALSEVRAPTLLLVGALDAAVIDLNRQALIQVSADKELVIIPGASHLFEEPGTLEQVLNYAVKWFTHHFSRCS
jgi:putative phosphoribosyl transferase